MRASVVQERRIPGWQENTETALHTRRDHLKTVSTRGIVTEVETGTPKICQKLLPPMDLVPEKYGKFLFSAQETVLSCQSSASWSPEACHESFLTGGYLGYLSVIILRPSQKSSTRTSQGQGIQGSHISSHLTPLTKNLKFDSKNSRKDSSGVWVILSDRKESRKGLTFFWGDQPKFGALKVWICSRGSIHNIPQLYKTKHSQSLPQKGGLIDLKTKKSLSTSPARKVRPAIRPRYHRCSIESAPQDSAKGPTTWSKMLGCFGI